MKNEHTSSTAPLLIGMAAGAALGAAGVMATNTSQRPPQQEGNSIQITLTKCPRVCSTIEFVQLSEVNSVPIPTRLKTSKRI